MNNGDPRTWGYYDNVHRDWVPESQSVKLGGNFVWFGDERCRRLESLTAVVDTLEPFLAARPGR